MILTIFHHQRVHERVVDAHDPTRTHDGKRAEGRDESVLKTTLSLKVHHLSLFTHTHLLSSESHNHTHQAFPWIPGGCLGHEIACTPTEGSSNRLEEVAPRPVAQCDGVRIVMTPPPFARSQGVLD